MQTFDPYFLKQNKYSFNDINCWTGVPNRLHDRQNYELQKEDCETSETAAALNDVDLVARASPTGTFQASKRLVN